MIFEQLEKRDYEQLIFCQDRHSGLKAIIAIHDTTLGPALGGARMWPYENEREAIIDALRLARGMTYKAAASGLNLGGGKAVIIGDPNKDKSEALFRAFGRYIQGLNGRYITARDVGTNESDMDAIYQETRFVTGVRGAGNPSPATAYGVYRGMKAAALTAFGTDELRGKTIAVQGVGEVAFHLCEYLHKEGANLIVADISADQVERAVAKYGAKKVGVDEIYEVDCDIFSPCALGGVLNDHTIPRLKAKAIAGSANNQLLENRHGDMLAERGVVYAPDYVINAGGLMNAADELIGYQRERAMKKVETIYDNVLRVFEISERDGVPSHVAADRLAEERIESMKRSRNAFLLNERHMLNRNDH